mmetsp:Transcript_39277/g.121418  ORF Transcript_39277/g.121418 Transcript_39277/m.121418 type:complete len:226 (-) Transcript_39277:12-689(-)
MPGHECGASQSGSKVAHRIAAHHHVICRCDSGPFRAKSVVDVGDEILSDHPAHVGEEDERNTVSVEPPKRVDGTMHCARAAGCPRPQHSVDVKGDATLLRKPLRGHRETSFGATRRRRDEGTPMRVRLGDSAERQKPFTSDLRVPHFIGHGLRDHGRLLVRGGLHRESRFRFFLQFPGPLLITALTLERIPALQNSIKQLISVATGTFPRRDESCTARQRTAHRQ